MYLTRSVLKEEHCSQTKSSQVIARSLDSSLTTLKPTTEAYKERNKPKRNLFHFILTSLSPHTPVNYAELAIWTLLKYAELDPLTPVINRN